MRYGSVLKYLYNFNSTQDTSTRKCLYTQIFFTTVYGISTTSATELWLVSKILRWRDILKSSKRFKLHYWTLKNWIHWGHGVEPSGHTYLSSSRDTFNSTLFWVILIYLNIVVLIGVMFTFLVVVVFLIFLWFYMRWNKLKRYWKERGVPHYPPHPIMGSLTFLQKQNPVSIF